MIGIYKITEKNNPTNFYIGQSNNIDRRFKEHIYKTTKQSRIPFDDEITNKGKDAFLFEVLEVCSINELNDKERYWIDKLDAIKSGNKNKGGLTDVVGSHNPNAKLTEDEVVRIRQAYNNHERQKDVYKEFEDKISFGCFQAVWQGKSWAHIMPEVFTPENKQYYVYKNSQGSNGAYAQFTDEEVIQLRHRYVNETAKQIYEDYKDRVSYQTFQAMLWGRSYSTLPIYKKKEKKWINI